jgi:hypothetical protein
MKILYILLLTFILTSCNKGNEMKSIETLASEVVSSSTVTEEEQALEKIWEYVYKNRIYIEIFSIDAGGVKLDINEIEELSTVAKVQVIFSKNEDTYTLEWAPHKLDNVFILFREK